MNQKPPNLFILGAAKAGTTTLADSLRQHSDIFISRLKEPTFFSSDNNYALGMKWYLDCHFQNSGAYRYRGEASPSYLYFAQKVARRIQNDLPNKEIIKFIVVFRNPIDRAYSHYWQNVNRVGFPEELTFEEALEAEDERLQLQDKELNDFGRIRCAYFNAGLYAKQLKTFWDFYPRENFLLLLHEDLFLQDFSKTMNSVQSFLQVRPQEIKYEHSNAARRPRSRAFEKIVRNRSFLKNLVKMLIPSEERKMLKLSILKINAVSLAYPPMAYTTKERLKEKYIPEIKELEILLDRDLSAWLK